MDKLFKILPKVLEKRKLSSDALASHVVFTAKTFFVNRYSESMLKKIIPTKFQDNCLYIDVKGASYAQEVSLVKLDLIEFIKKRHPKVNVEKVVVSNL